MFDAIRSFLQSDLYFIVGNLASILSLIVTIFVLINVREIKRSHVFMVRLPDLRKQLRHHSREISRYMQDLETSRPEIRVEIGRAEVTLNSLKGKVPRTSRSSITKVLTVVKSVDVSKAGIDDILEVYAELIKIEEELKNIQADFESEL